MAKFQVGEEAFFVRDKAIPIGKVSTDSVPDVVTITKVLQVPPVVQAIAFQWYQINGLWEIREDCLRKKPKPDDQQGIRSFESLIRWCRKAGRKNMVIEQA
jgi:hypothetical protein